MYVATVPTVYGIETQCILCPKLDSFVRVATALTVYGIETGRGEDVIAEIFLVATAPTVYGMRRRV